VSGSRYLRDARVDAVMVKVNRWLYLREVDATLAAEFEDVAWRIRPVCVEAIDSCGSS
jgi:hypothetical protein